MNYQWDGRKRPNRKHKSPVSVYMLDDNSTNELEELSCIYCKRTIADVKGMVDKIISTPVPVHDFGMAVNIRCKLCGQNYRVLANAKVTEAQG